ncbi:MAG: hypothetical protein ACI4KH_02960, partial [Oscillospiraceae bacterium]
MDRYSENTPNQEQAIKKFISDYLNKPKSSQTIHAILSYVADYYRADRSYILEWNKDRSGTGNTYEWCRDGVSSKENVLRSISFEELKCWF